VDGAKLDASVLAAGECVGDYIFSGDHDNHRTQRLDPA
jgi:hypothetical protein